MYITEIKLENVKAFKDVTFSFTRPGGTLAGWTVFVGGNSSGKTTLLRAIALALMGPDAGNRILGGPLGWISEGKVKASATATISWDPALDTFKGKGNRPGGEFEAGVEWSREDGDEIPVFRGFDLMNTGGVRAQTANRGPWSPNADGWFVAGYGPMRRLSGSSSESMRFSAGSGAESRFVSLFREDAALSESEEWLRRMHARSLEADRNNKAEIDTLVAGVIALLGDGLLPEGMTFSRITVDNVYLNDGRGVEIPMREVSDGCRSIYATVLDIVHGLYETYGGDSLFETDDEGSTVVASPGIVIIDEVEAHLHPAWQHTIPTWFKKHFPAIQFLVSTHSPLIAQEADPNGLFILPLQSDYLSVPRPASEVEYKKVRMGKAFDIVLGVAFGLESTRSQWATEQIDKWQILNARKEAGLTLSSVEERAYEKLRGQMELVFN